MGLSLFIGFLACTGLVLAGGAAHAEDEQSVRVPAPSPETRMPRTTVLLAPSFLNPFAEIGIERRVAPWLGIALVAGGGWADAKSEGQHFHRAPAYDFGAQIRTSLVNGTHHGLTTGIAFGLQGLYGHIRGNEPGSPNPFMLPPGVSIAPFFSVETIVRDGFTASVDTGLAYYLVTAPWERELLGPRLAFFERINVGWSFN